MAELNSEITQNYFAEICFCGELETVSFSAPMEYKKVNEGNSLKKDFTYGFNCEDGKIIFTGNATKDFTINIMAEVSLTGIIPDKELKVIVSKNGNLLNIEGSVTTSGEILFNKIRVSSEVSLNQNDYLEILAANFSGIESMKIKDLKIVLVIK